MRRRAIAAVVALAVAACTDPGDLLFSREFVPPVEVSPGLFRVTFDPEPDYVRGFTPTDDTILFRAATDFLLGIEDTTWRMIGIPAPGGLGGVEHAALYRQALDRPIGALIDRGADRVLLWWQRGNDYLFDGPGGCRIGRHLLLWRFSFLHLAAEDGAALASVPTWFVRVPHAADTLGFTPGTALAFRMRFTFGEVEAENGANPIGPAVAGTGSLAYFSDGQTLWHFDLSNPRAAPDSVGQGIFPTLSSDGALLAYANPVGVDSMATSTYVPPPLLVQCLQEDITFTATRWVTSVVELATGRSLGQFSGTEPVFDSAGEHVLVRRPTGLVWINLLNRSEEAVPLTEGAFNAAISPDGHYLAFSKTVSNNTDVYFVKLN